MNRIDLLMAEYRVEILMMKYKTQRPWDRLSPFMQGYLIALAAYSLGAILEPWVIQYTLIGLLLP